VKTCPVCTTDNPDNQRFCIQCSLDLSSLSIDSAQELIDKNVGIKTDANVVIRPGNVKLIVVAGKEPDIEYLLDEARMVIGRRDPSQSHYPDIDLYDQEDGGSWTITRSHAVITFRDDKLFLTDLGSTNGTFINEPHLIKPHEETQLKIGDVIAIGKKILLKLKEYIDR